MDRARLDAASKRLTDNFKEYHAQISKFSKELDKVHISESTYDHACLTPVICLQVLDTTTADFDAR